MQRTIRVIVFILALIQVVCLPARASTGDGVPGEPQLRTYHDLVLSARLTSPRSTWLSFFALMRAYNATISEEGFSRENRQYLRYLQEEIVQCFDLRGTPPSMRTDVAMETAVYLSEILGRVSLDASNLPDRQGAFEEIKSGYPGVWHIDDTSIAIRLVDGGDFSGSFQFTHQTINEARQTYLNLSHRPYVDAAYADLYAGYFLTPGPAIPLHFIRSLPAWMGVQYFGNTLWQWAATLLCMLSLLVLIVAVLKVVYRLAAGGGPVLRCLLRLIVPVLGIAGALMLNTFVKEEVFATGELLLSARFATAFIELCAVVYAIIVLGDLLVALVAVSRARRHQAIDNSLLRLGVRLMTITISVVVVMEGMQRVGFSLSTVLAGAGVTGLAVALAAQESLRNIFGSIMLLLDKPFVVGQRVQVRGHDGIVESIGLRSTKIRQLSGHLSSIPNEDVARADIENIGERPFIRKTFVVRVAYDTPLDKVDEATAILSDIVAMDADDPAKSERNSHVNAPAYPPRIAFSDLNEDSLGLVVHIWYVPADYWGFLRYCHVMNREIIRRFGLAGIRFALPSQTIHMASDGG